MNTHTAKVLAAEAAARTLGNGIPYWPDHTTPHSVACSPWRVLSVPPVLRIDSRVARGIRLGIQSWQYCRRAR